MLPGLPISFNTIALALQTETTIGEANGLLGELEAEIVGGIPGKAGTTSGILFLRLPTMTHTELIETLSRIRADPHVRRAVQDVLLGPTIISKPHAGSPFDWKWDLAPLGDNWGLEVIRAPQLWNFNAAIARSAPVLPEVLVLDDGYDASHPDLAFLAPPTRVDAHGTHVAGIIGAGFSNGIGTDGVNPFARMMPVSSAQTGVLSSWGELTISRADELIRSRPGIKVVNSSLGYNWVSNFNIDAKNDESAQELASEEGAILREMLVGLEADGLPLPVWLTASGNDSGSPFGDQVALWASPMANAALEHGARNIIVVESVGTSPNIASGETVRAPDSNLGGHLSAPGVDVMSTTPSPRYQLMSGTSMATPHVAGLVAYLYALDPSLPSPTLQSNPMLDLLLASAVPAQGGARPRIDAFAAALEVDRVQGGTNVLRLLADIDDGTADGNQRTTEDGAADYTAEAGGDGQIDMSDFRRWRDWALQIHFPAAHLLDGSAGHPKKDLNGNGDIQQGAPEDLYPRGDLNGDGKLTIDATVNPVGGAIGQSVTDLGVLQHLFNDPDYAVGDLPALISSGDLHLDATDCLSASGGATARTSVLVQGTAAPPLPNRIHDPAQPLQIYTVAAAPTGTGYVLRMEALDAAGVVIASVEDEETILLGMDLRWHPTCGAGPITLTGFDGAMRLETETESGSPCTVEYTPDAPVPYESGIRQCGSGDLNAQGQWSVRDVPYGPMSKHIQADLLLYTAAGTGAYSMATVSFDLDFESDGSMCYELVGELRADDGDMINIQLESELVGDVFNISSEGTPVQLEQGGPFPAGRYRLHVFGRSELFKSGTTQRHGEAQADFAFTVSPTCDADG